MSYSCLVSSSPKSFLNAKEKTKRIPYDSSSIHRVFFINPQKFGLQVNALEKKSNGNSSKGFQADPKNDLKERNPKEEKVWGEKTLAQMEDEILGFQPPNKTKTKSKKNMESKDTEDSYIRRHPDGRPWTVLDELEERNFGAPDEVFQEWPIVVKLQNFGAWLADSTTTKEEEESSDLFGGIRILLGMFSVWLLLVLIACGVIHLPGPLHFIEEFLTADVQNSSN